MAPVMPMKEIINPAWFPGAHKRIPKFIKVPIFDPSMGRDTITPLKKVPKFLSKGKGMAGAAGETEGKNPHGGSKSLDDDDTLPLSIKNDPKANWEKSPPDGNSKKIEEALKAPNRIKAMEIAKKAIRIAESFARNANAIMTGGSPVSMHDIKVSPRPHTVHNVVLCTHASVPMDCCICCHKVSDHCCQYCESHQNFRCPRESRMKF